MSAKLYTYTESRRNTIGIRGTPVVGVAVVVDVAKVSGICLIGRGKPPVGPFTETALYLLFPVVQIAYFLVYSVNIRNQFIYINRQNGHNSLHNLY